MDNELRRKLISLESDLSNLMFLGDIERHLSELVDLQRRQLEVLEEIKQQRR